MIDDDRTEARVRAAFHVERLRAEADLQFAPLLPRPRSRPRLFVRLAAVAVVTVIVVAAAGLILDLRIQTATAPSGAPSPTVSQVPSPTSFQATPVPTPDMTGRYSDGIPMTWQGQPVLRWADALARSGTANDATPFYVGVWLNIDMGPRSCPAEFGNPSAPNSWIRVGGCPDNRISGDEGGPTDDLNGVATFQFAVGHFETGPAILRVHVHDPRASDCGPRQAICDRMIVMEQAVWAGDSLTQPRPFSVADVIATSAAVEPGTSLSLLPDNGPHYDPPLAGAIALSSGGIQPADLHVQGAYIMTSADAIHRALPDVQPGAAGALLPSAFRLSESGSGPGYSFSVTEHWLVVDNVAFAVLLEPEPSAADKAWLASLETALRATH